MIKHLVDLLEEFVRTYFDKILLTGIFAALVLIGAEAASESVKNWAMGQANTVIGAIIMLTTGEVMNRLKTKPPENKDKTDDPSQ